MEHGKNKLLIKLFCTPRNMVKSILLIKLFCKFYKYTFVMYVIKVLQILYFKNYSLSGL